MFNAEILVIPFPCGKYGILLWYMQNDVGSEIAQLDGFVSSQNRALDYLNSGQDLCTLLSKVERAGGKIVL